LGGGHKALRPDTSGPPDRRGRLSPRGLWLGREIQHGARAVPNYTGSFDYVRRAPHFAQDDSGRIAAARYNRAA
jgi:hypothetical protein